MNFQSLEKDIAHNRHSKTWQLNATSHLELDALAYKGHYENKSQKKKKNWLLGGVEEIKLFQATLPTFWDCLKNFLHY